MGIWFGCSHKNSTFPITRPRKVREARRRADTYIVCLDCGYEMPYSWNEMRAYKERRRGRPGAGVPEQQPDEAVAV
jgi:hypothetical protein